MTVLSQHREPLSLREILDKLPQAYAERSVRRWLARLVHDDQVIKIGAKKGTRYRANEVLSRQSPQQSVASDLRTPGVAKDIAAGEADTDQGSPFSPSSLAAVAYVRQPLFKRKPVSYNTDWLASYQPNRTFYFDVIDRTRLAERGRRTVSQEPAGTYARRIYSRLLIDLSYNSSRLEGNTYSLIDTQRLLIDGAGAAGKLDGEATMILNHKEAIRHLVDHGAHLDVTYDEVLTLHYLLSDGLVPPDRAGAIRDEGVRVGASTFVPFESRDRLASLLMDTTRKAAAIDDPFEQSLFLLVNVAYLQAFWDVNKRTSRLCANIPLLRHNLVPLSFNSVAADDYALAMIAVYEKNDTGPIADLYQASYFRTCQEYDATVEALGFDEVRVRYREQRRRAVAHIIGELLGGDALSTYLEHQVAPQVPGEHRERFLTTIQEDLVQISPQRLAGLGITRQQLGRWLALS